MLARRILWLCLLVLTMPTAAYAGQCKIPPGERVPRNCQPHQWPDVCEYNGVLTWADNGLPVVAGTMDYMAVDYPGMAIPIVPCRFPGLRTKPKPE